MNFRYFVPRGFVISPEFISRGCAITDVNKIVTDDLDVKNQIDMKGNTMINLGDGTANHDAVNKVQLDLLE